jgi:flagellar L-ring protein precursor FlgH
LLASKGDRVKVTALFHGLCLSGLLSVFAMAVSADSLWTRRHPDDRETLWTTRRALRVGDVVTVLIQEESDSKAREEFKRDRETKAEAEHSINLGGHLPNIDSLIGKTGSMNFQTARNIDAEHEGNTEKKFTTRLAAIVKEELFNGNLVIEATRELIIQDEVTTVIISGIVRPDDIRGDNTIVSENIAEAKIRYEGKGSIGEVRKKGRFGQRILDFLIPF